MTKRAMSEIPPSARRLLDVLAAHDRPDATRRQLPALRVIDPQDLALLMSADLVRRRKDRGIEITSAGRAHLARHELSRSAQQIDPFLAQHLGLDRRAIDFPDGRADVTIDDAESPLAWLARRKGRDGRPLIEPVQRQAGERLRVQFTRAGLTPRVTSNWSASVARGRRGIDGARASTFTDVVIAARQQVQRALEAVGPEFAGLLLDVCCFLKGLEDIERERGWPPRSAKVVLQLALDRLARHYGLAAEARGLACASIRTWLAPDAGFAVEESEDEDS